MAIGEIFKAYDIRGIYPTEIYPELVYKIGRAFVSWRKKELVVVGRDCRIGSEELHKALVKGLTDQGANVIDIGLCSTPMLYYASKMGDAIMVTASHNPKQFNGLKMCKKGAVAVSGANGLNKIQAILDDGKFEKAKKGKARKKTIIAGYVKEVKKFAKKIKKFKAVIDIGNGMSSITAQKIFGRILKASYLFPKMDGNFPNHEPNPMKPESLVALKKEVVKQKANIGIIFDGDVDRVVFVDEKGNDVRADFITILVARELLKKYPNHKILYDVRSSWAVREEITKDGGIPIMTRIGHSYIKTVMREEESIFAGELSGHYYYKDFMFADNADITALLVLSLMTSEKKTLSKLVAPLKKYYQSGELNFSVENKEAVIQKLEDAYVKKAHKLHKIDGLSIEFENWWFNARPSGTENVLRLNIEAKTQKLLEEKKRELVRQLT